MTSGRVAPGTAGACGRARTPATAAWTPPETPATVAYLDSSALIKLVAVEPESAALRRQLAHWPQRTSSLLARVEVTRAADRLGASAPALAVRVLAGLDLLAVDPIIPAANQLAGVLLRSLDAIHLATAASIASELGALITYDHRMITEGLTLGLACAHAHLTALAWTAAGRGHGLSAPRSGQGWPRSGRRRRPSGPITAGTL